MKFLQELKAKHESLLLAAQATKVEFNTKLLKWVDDNGWITFSSNEWSDTTWWVAVHPSKVKEFQEHKFKWLDGGENENIVFFIV